MEKVNTRTKRTNPSKLAANTAVFLIRQETVQATKYLNFHNIPHKIMRSSEGYWLNVSWFCGITAPLTYQELDQLPKYLEHQSRRTTQWQNVSNPKKNVHERP